MQFLRPVRETTILASLDFPFVNPYLISIVRSLSSSSLIVLFPFPPFRSSPTSLLVYLQSLVSRLSSLRVRFSRSYSHQSPWDREPSGPLPVYDVHCPSDQSNRGSFPRSLSHRLINHPGPRELLYMVRLSSRLRTPDTVTTKVQHTVGKEWWDQTFSEVRLPGINTI